MPTITIRDWDRHFENNRTRELAAGLKWVPMPTGHDGAGYTELLDHPNGAAHFGAWCALVQVAAKCSPRGVLARSAAEPPGRPLDATDLARMTRIPRQVIEEAIPRLAGIGWIDVTPCAATTPQEGATTSQEGATTSHPLAPRARARGPEGKGEEGTGVDRTGEGQDRTGAEKQLRAAEAAPGSPQGDFADDIRTVLAAYATYHPRAKPGPKEKAKIRDRLKEKWSAQDLVEAVHGNHRSPFHCGDNKDGKRYHALGLIFRDADHVQQFLDVPPEGTIVPSHPMRKRLNALDNWLAIHERHEANGQQR